MASIKLATAALVVMFLVMPLESMAKDSGGGGWKSAVQEMSKTLSCMDNKIHTLEAAVKKLQKQLSKCYSESNGEVTLTAKTVAVKGSIKFPNTSGKWEIKEGFKSNVIVPIGQPILGVGLAIEQTQFTGPIPRPGLPRSGNSRYFFFNNKGRPGINEPDINICKSDDGCSAS